MSSFRDWWKTFDNGEMVGEELAEAAYAAGALSQSRAPEAVGGEVERARDGHEWQAQVARNVLDKPIPWSIYPKLARIFENRPRVNVYWQELAAFVAWCAVPELAAAPATPSPVAPAMVVMCRSCAPTATWASGVKEDREESCIKCDYATQWRYPATVADDVETPAEHPIANLLRAQRPATPSPVAPREPVCAPCGGTKLYVGPSAGTTFGPAVTCPYCRPTAPTPSPVADDEVKRLRAECHAHADAIVTSLEAVGFASPVAAREPTTFLSQPTSNTCGHCGETRGHHGPGALRCPPVTARCLGSYTKRAMTAGAGSVGGECELRDGHEPPCGPVGARETCGKCKVCGRTVQLSPKSGGILKHNAPGKGRCDGTMHFPLGVECNCPDCDGHISGSCDKCPCARLPPGADEGTCHEPCMFCRGETHGFCARSAGHPDFFDGDEGGVICACAKHIAEHMRKAPPVGAPTEAEARYAAHENEGPPWHAAESCNQRGCPWHGERTPPTPPPPPSAPDGGASPKEKT